MKNDLSISVIIPTFNRAELLKRALKSIQHQTFPPYEVLVIDDGSTDNTKELVNSQFPKVRFFYQEQKGVSSARNRGIQLARGNWIAFLDSDDEWMPDKLRVQMQEITKLKEPSICHTEEIWLRNGTRVNSMKKHRKYGGRIYRKCLPLCVISPSSVLIHKDIFKTIGLFDESLPACEDYDLWLRICSQYSVHFIDIPLIIKYGGHADQLSRAFWGMDRFRIFALEKMLKEPALSAEDYTATLEMLLKKITIYLYGAKKREKLAEVERFERKKEYYSNIQQS